MKSKQNLTSALIVVLLIAFFSTLIVIYQKSEKETPKVAGLKTKTFEIQTSVFIGDHRFTLFGYTSPKAKVSFSGLGIFDETYADEQGFFIFKNRFSPLSPREACLTSQDVFGRLSPPVCLPPFPVNYNVEIGPVIMPPTISVDVGEYFVGDEAILSGQTIPNTKVDFSVFTEQSVSTDFYKFLSISGGNRNLLSLIKKVEAFSFPQLQVRSDEKGNFSVSLPTNKPEKFRIFSQADFANSPSPKSLTLNISVLPWWMVIFKIFGLVFKVIKERWLEVSLLIEIVVLVVFIFNHFFHPHRLAKTRAIVLREKFPLLFNPSGV